MLGVVTRSIPRSRIRFRWAEWETYDSKVKVAALGFRADSVQPEFDWDTLHDFERETISVLIADQVSRIFTMRTDIGRMSHQTRLDENGITLGIMAVNNVRFADKNPH